MADGNTAQVTSTLGAADMTGLPSDKDKLVNLAKQDLAGRLNIAPAAIGVIATMDITWPDISAGCNSEPGQILTKGRVYGYRVVLEANGAKYVFQVGETGQVMLCVAPIPGANNPLLMTPSGTSQDPHNNEP
jgi:hypothetical protein